MDFNWWLNWAGPSRAKRMLVWLAGFLLLVLYVGDFLERLRSAPENTRSLMAVLANTSPIAWLVLLFAALCILVATSDLWRPALGPKLSASVTPQTAERAIKFWLVGRPTIAPFRVLHIGNDENGPVYSEQVWLRLEALRPMRDVACQITLIYERKENTVDLTGLFTGVVNRGMKRDILILDRRFQWVLTSYMHASQKKEQSVRQDIGATLLPELAPLQAEHFGGQYAICIDVFHAEGPDRAAFIVDLSESVRVSSRVVGLSGPIERLAEG